MSKQIYLKIKGRVQGVGFRWYVSSAAQKYGVYGYVKNCPDGSVEVMAQGDVSSVDSFERACRQGPSGSRVDDVQSNGGTVENMTYDSFEIR